MRKQEFEKLKRKFCKNLWQKGAVPSDLENLPPPPLLNPEVFRKMCPVRVYYSVHTNSYFPNVSIKRYVLREGEGLPPDSTNASSQLHDSDEFEPVQTTSGSILNWNLYYLYCDGLDFGLNTNVLLSAIKDTQQILILLDVIQKTNTDADYIYQVYSNDSLFLVLYLVALQHLLSKLSSNKVRLHLKFRFITKEQGQIDMFQENLANFIKDDLQKFSDFVSQSGFSLWLREFLRKFGIDFDLTETIKAIESDRTSLDPRFNLNALWEEKSEHFTSVVDLANLGKVSLQTELSIPNQWENRVANGALLKIKVD